MMSFSLSGGVEVFGFISPSEPTDTYPVIDPIYGIDGLRNVDTISDLDNIPDLRRRSGMVVGVSGGTEYYKLNPSPWNFDFTDWSVFNSGGGGSGLSSYTYNNNTFTILDVTGGTYNATINEVTGLTVNGVLSATTYENLPIDVFVTGGTYSGGTSIFTNNTGGTFNVSGFYTGTTDVFVTGGTYSNGTSIFTNNTGGTFNVTGFYTGATDNDRYVTGFTYSDNTFTISDNSGSTFNSTINTVTGLTVNGNLSVTGNTTVKGITGTTAVFSGSGQSIVTIIGSGSTLPIFTILGSSGELFSVTDSLVGSLFSVNDISGLPILEVFSDSTTLMGDYLSPSLNTTKKVSAGIGTTTIYSIPVSAYTGAFFDYTVSDGTNLRSGNIRSVFNSSNISYNETSTTDIGNTSGVTFNMVISGGTSAVLQTSGTTAGWTVKTIVRSI